MGEIWTDKNKYATWLKVELVACEAMAKIGKIPPRALKNIKKNQGFLLQESKKSKRKPNMM